MCKKESESKCVFSFSSVDTTNQKSSLVTPTAGYICHSGIKDEMLTRQMTQCLPFPLLWLSLFLMTYTDEMQQRKALMQIICWEVGDQTGWEEARLTCNWLNITAHDSRFTEHLSVMLFQLKDHLHLFLLRARWEGLLPEEWNKYLPLVPLWFSPFFRSSFLFNKKSILFHIYSSRRFLCLPCPEEKTWHLASGCPSQPFYSFTPRDKGFPAEFSLLKHRQLEN